MNVATADLADRYADIIQCCDLQMRNFGARVSFSGSIRTVRCLADIALLKKVVQGPGDGAVLVIDAGGSLRKAVLGDQIGKTAEQNGWAGIVLNGAIRDSTIMRNIGIGVKAMGSTPSKGTETGGGDTDVAVTFGGVTFTPGDQLFADEDGVVVVPAGTVRCPAG